MNRAKSIPVYELTEADFTRHPVWQFRLDAEGEDDVDESHAIPAAADLCLGTFGSFMVRANYRLENRRELPGAVQVDILGRKATFTPAFVYVRRKVIDPLSSDAETRIARITKEAKTRPTHWTLEVAFNGEAKPRSGRIAQSNLLKALGLLARLVSLRIFRGSAK